MARLRRVLLAAVIFTAAAAALYQFCYLPWHCNAVIASVETVTSTAFAQRDSWRGRRLARANVEAVRDCVAYPNDNVSARILLAANLRIASGVDAAIAQYEEALRWDRRPELYFELGSAQIAAGRKDAGIANLTQAVSFSPTLINDVEDGEARVELYRRLGARLVRAGNLLRNGDFSLRNRYGATTFNGTGGSRSIAAAWSIYNRSPGSVRCEIVPSTRLGAAGSMLHVIATSRSSGLSQIWGAPGTGPSAGVTSAWVYVVRGKVSIGSGNLATVSPDAISSTTGQWEHIQGRTQSCPVNETDVFSFGGEAEFDIMDVTLTAVPDAPQCAQP